jgi:hypothetical protein
VKRQSDKWRVTREKKKRVEREKPAISQQEPVTSDLCSYDDVGME